jgi:hypothetical protein
LWGGVQVEDSLDVTHDALDVIVAAKEVLKPAHVRPVYEEDESDIADDSFVDDDGQDGADLDAFSDPLHAELVPAPAAVMSNEVDCREIE